MNNKAMFSVIGLSLLLLISVVSIVSFQGWFTIYSSQTFVKLESESSGGELTPIRIPEIIGDKIYIENTQESELEIQEIRIDGNTCGGSGTYGPGIIDLDLNCGYALKEKGESEILIITDEGLISQKFHIEEDELTYTCLNGTSEGFENGNGTIGNPWQICNCSMLQLMDNSSYNEDYFEITTDIDCSMTKSWNSGNGFDPIDILDINLEGNGNSINNLYINRPNSSHIGLLGNTRQIYPERGIKNLALLNVDITGEWYVGSFSGTQFLINNSYATGKVTGDRYVGGLQGTNSNFFISVSNVYDSYASVEVNGDDEVGGLFGVMISSELDSIFTVSSVSGTTNLGSIVGRVTALPYPNCVNVYWLNTSNNPDNHVGTGIGCSGDDITIQNDISYFYGNNNEPMASWDTDIWSFSDNRLPQLIKQN